VLAILSVKTYKAYMNAQAQRKLETAQAWLQQNIPLLSAINYSCDKVFGAGYEKLDYITITGCTLSISRTFHAHAQKVPSGAFSRGQGTDYTESFSEGLNYLELLPISQLNLGGVKYPTLQLRLTEGMVSWQSHYRNDSNGTVYGQESGVSPNYVVGIYFSDLTSAKTTLAHLQSAILACRRLESQ
jgi:hypothetical protein